MTSNHAQKKTKKCKLTVGLEPTTSGLEVQCAIQLRHASNWFPYSLVLYNTYKARMRNLLLFVIETGFCSNVSQENSIK